ncbi:MAG: class I tRNA ligase family protein, partial [Candidatus Liptonbacteria bacterium]
TGPNGDHESDRAISAKECFEGTGMLVNSGEFSGKDSVKAGWEMTEKVGGIRKIQYHLRDWLISRQRYWSAPIPMIYCPQCATKDNGEHAYMPGWYAVPEKDLPVELPFVKDFRPKGSDQSPLASVKSFYETKCPGCGGKARRETDVSDTFLDSAWYYLRYLSPNNSKAPFDKILNKKWLPVDMYIGGAEHSVLHLLYVRFITMVLYDIGFINFEEPMAKFRAHGLLIKEGSKMSKSKGNVVNPDEYIKKFGADALRMYLMFLAPFEQGGDFRDQGILGTTRFLERAWKMGERVESNKSGAKNVKAREELNRAMNHAIKKVTEDIADLHYNTAVSVLMILLNEMEKHKELNGKKELETFLLLLAPFAPHITEELWHEVCKNKSSIHAAKWPKYDVKKIVEQTFTLVIQVNGRTRHTISARRGISEKEAKEIALKDERVRNYMAGKNPQKVIYVPGRLINIVV